MDMRRETRSEFNPVHPDMTIGLSFPSQTTLQLHVRRTGEIPEPPSYQDFN